MACSGIRLPAAPATWRNLHLEEAALDEMTTLQSPLLRRCDEPWRTPTLHPAPFWKQAFHAAVSGLGFGIMSGIFSLVNILVDSLGPGTVGIHGDSPHYFISSAFITLAIVLLHIFWGIVFFDACERKQWWALLLVISSHLLVSGLTFLNPRYESSIIPVYVVVFLMGVWAFFAAGGSFRNLKMCLLCRDKEFLLANHRPT